MAELTVCPEPDCGQSYGPGIERAIHLRKCHMDIYKSEYSEQRARRNFKRGWDEDGGNLANMPADNDEDEVPDDLAFRIPGYAASRYDLKRLEKCFNGGRFRCPTQFCCKSYKSVDGLQYHLAKSMCVPSEEWLMLKRNEAQDGKEDGADPLLDAEEDGQGQARRKKQQDKEPMDSEAQAAANTAPATTADATQEATPKPEEKAANSDWDGQLIRDEPFFTNYRWPQSESGVWTITQAVLRTFLDGLRVHRIYPELERRYATDDERTFIKKNNIGREAHIFGIVVFKAQEALRIVQEFHPEKYEQLLQYRAGTLKYVPTDPRRIGDQPNITAEEALANAEHVKEIAMQCNQDFLSLRRSTGGCVYEPATQTVWSCIHDQARPALPAPTTYPAPLIPGQYFDGTMRFTLQQARAYVTPPPPPALSRNPAARPNGDEPPGKAAAAAAAAAVVSDETKALQKHVQLRIQERQRGVKSLVVMPRAPSNAECAMCHVVGRKGREELVTCVKCHNTSHPSCLELSPDLVAVIKTYDWECMECKTCTVCRDPYDEEHLMFCDECDRGYHTYCVQLQSIPRGRWVCKSCGQCASCGSTTPGGEGARWRHEYTKPSDSSDRRFLCTLCVSCSMLFRAGNFCPFCLIVYRSNDTDLPMICCDTCDRWVHCDCDHISQAAYKKLSASGAKYTCSLCRGEQEERNDAFHRKNRR
eukprot:m.243782 g.243782  ORF g.243782 m.243782 type:complete len:702 (-) comp28528_c0_seq1:178-2283(-)